MPEYTNLSDVIVDGRLESSAQGGVMGSFAVMPSASALNKNCIVLYTGTTGTYVSGRFYMCVESEGSYSWQPVTISGTEAPVFTASRALVSDSLGAASASSVTATELAYLSGLTGNLVTLLGNKVDKVSGMGLSQNSYTTGEKNKLAGIAAGAEVNVISAVQNNGVPVEVVGKTVNITHPTLLSQFTNDTQFITSTVSNLQNYYDKATVNDMISAIPKFAISVVDELPSSGQSSTTIYLTPKSGSSGDVYDEYLWVNSTWEKIGSTAVQFSFDQSGTDILINGTAIRSATSAQSGVMTTAQVSALTTATSNITNLQSQYSSLNGTVSSLSSRLDTAESTLSTTVSQISTLAPTVSVNEEVNPPTITVGLNGKSATANLPIGGGSEWEELDITSLPSDFQDGDIIALELRTLGITNTPPLNSWTTDPDTVEIGYVVMSSVAPYGLIFGSIRSGLSSEITLFPVFHAVGYIESFGISLVNVNDWNDPTANKISIRLQILNGAGWSYRTIKIGPNSNADLVYRLYRIKK